MRRIVLALAVLLAVPSIARADDASNPYLSPAKVRTTIAACIAKNRQDDSSTKASHDCTDRYLASCSAAGHDTTLAMNFCSEAVLAYWDGVVAARTRAMLVRREPGLAAEVRNGDAAWRAYRRSRCGMYRFFQGTIWGPVSGACQIDLTVQRATDLLDLGAGYVAPS